MYPSFSLLLLCTMVSAIALHTVRSSGRNRKGPLCVLVHGLDSFSGTWTCTMESLSIPCLAVDQRGCGQTVLGPLEDFSRDALVKDLHEIIQKEEGPVVLVGHSLGGRIAMAYAASHPETLASLVIEDMDIEPRPMGLSPVTIPEFSGKLFERKADTKEALEASIRSYGYSQEQLQDWWQKGRLVRLDSGECYSNMNPDFRRLCYETVLATDHGRRDCQIIARQSPWLPCHVMVAGKEGTVCTEESIQEMKYILGDQLTIHRYPLAGHSIHSTDAQAFCRTVEELVQG